MLIRLACLACVVVPFPIARTSTAAPVVFPASAGGNGHAYDVVVDPTLTRGDADLLAAAAGGHLVTITSAQEQAFVESLLQDKGAPTGSYWMGLERAGVDQFRWITGEPFQYNNFPGGEPNNFQGVEHAGQIYWSEDLSEPFAGRRGTWNDTPFTGYVEGDIPDLIRAGMIVERGLTDGGGNESPPAPIPLPPAVLAGSVTWVIVMLGARRHGCGAA